MLMKLFGSSRMEPDRDGIPLVEVFMRDRGLF